MEGLLSLLGAAASFAILGMCFGSRRTAPPPRLLDPFRFLSLRELCQVFGPLHDALTPLHSRDITRRDSGRAAEDDRFGPLTFVPAPRPLRLLLWRAGLSRTMPRAARSMSGEHLAHTASARDDARTFPSDDDNAKPSSHEPNKHPLTSIDPNLLSVNSFSRRLGQEAQR
jgi:hypothetical protein